MELYLKFTMRFVALIAFLGFIGVLAYALKTEGDIQTPTQTAQGMVGGNAANSLQKEQSPLNMAHRTEKELKTLVTTLVSESLAAPTGDLQKTTQDVRKYFTTSGLSSYQRALQGASVTQTLQNSGMSLSVLVEDKPLLFTAKEHEGIYRWLFEVPIILSYIPFGTQNLIGSDAITNNKMAIRVQLRRVPYDESREGVQVESWAFTPRR